MAELLQIRARSRDGEPEGGENRGGTVRVRRSRAALRDALQVARAVLPHDGGPEENAASRAIHLLVGLPLTVLAVFAVGSSLSTEALATLSAFHWPRIALTLGVAVAEVGITWAATFLLALVFSSIAGRSKGRVHEALVCPYCRDQVAQDGTVVCARNACGALYHRECWDEVSVQYGGCAIYGCSSKKSREVTAAGYLVRLSRLVIAAAVFTPRVARALRDRSGDELAPVLRRSYERAKVWHRFANLGSDRQLAVVAVGVIAAIGACKLMADSSAELQLGRGWFIATAFAAFYAIPFGLLALPFVVAILTLPVYFGSQALWSVFQSELAALLRVDEGGATVLGRLRSGGGKKECC